VKGFLGLFVRELLITKNRLPRFLVGLTVMPTLYMLAFGWGIGQQVTQQGMPYITFLVPGLIAMSTMRHSFSISMELNICRFYWRVFDHFQASPVGFGTIAAAEIAAASVRGCAAAVFIYLLGLVFGVSIGLSPALVAGVLLNCIVFGALGVIAAMLVRKHSDQSILANFIITPMSFLCGTVFSLDVMPDWARYVVRALPLTYSTRIIRNAAWERNVAMVDLLILVAFAACAVIVAWWAVGMSRQ